MASFTAGTTFVDGVSNDVTAAKLGALVTNATPTSGFIQDRTAETVTATNDTLLIGDASDSNNLKRITVANFAQTLPTANVTTGTIETGTFGTTTSTAQIVTSGTFLGAITGSTNVINIGSGQIYKDASGKVLIGTTSNDTGGRLEVKQGSSEIGIGIQSSGTDDSKLYFRTASGTYGGDILFNGSYVKVSSGTTERLRINSSGDVGIGTASPGARLSVDSSTSGLYATFNSTSTNGGYLEFQSIGTVQGDIGTAKQIVSGSTSDFAVNARGARNLVLGTNNTERLRIDSSGNVLIGGTDVEPAGGAVNGISLKPSSSATVSNGMVEICNANSPALILGSTTGDATLARFRRAGTVVGSISVTAGATAFVTSSDYRLKTNLEPISNAIERIKQLPVYRFNWIADESGNKVDGFVAHEAQSIVPEAIVGARDEIDAEGNPIYQGIDQSKIVPLLTAALKEAITKIEVLESKVAALEAA